MTVQPTHTLALKQEIAPFVRWGLFSLDFILFFFGAVIAYFWRHGTPTLPENYLMLSIVSFGIFYIALRSAGLYRFGSLFHPLKQTSLVSLATACAILSVLVMLFFLKSSDDISRLWIFYWFFSSSFSVLVVRLFLSLQFKRKLKQGAYIRKVILVGAAHHIQYIAEHCENHNMLVVAQYITSGKNQATHIQQLNTKNDLLNLCLEGNIDDIILTADFGKDTTTQDHILAMLRHMPTAVRYCLPDVFHNRGVSIAQKWDGLPIVTLYRKPLFTHDLYTKRACDILFATLALILFTPIILVVALCIKLTSKGPVFYVQQRGGFGSTGIPVIKFRSMKTLDDGRAKIQQAQKDDPRITAIGKIIRKSNLDELPQLFNVLKGDMSLVGPRPHALSHDDEYAELIDSYAARHRMKPGITGWAQVNGLRGETDTLDKMEARVAHDLYYIENWSLALDLKILLLTPFTFFSKNAY